MLGKNLVVNIIGFGGHMASVSMTQVCLAVHEEPLAMYKQMGVAVF